MEENKQSTIIANISRDSVVGNYSLTNSVNIITCEEKNVLSMFRLGNLCVYLPISANFFTKLGFKIFLGIKLEKKI